MRPGELKELVTTLDGTGVSERWKAGRGSGYTFRNGFSKGNKVVHSAGIWLPSTPPTAQPQPVRAAAGMALKSSRIVPLVVGDPGTTSGVKMCPAVSVAPVTCTQFGDMFGSVDSPTIRRVLQNVYVWHRFPVAAVTKLIAKFDRDAVEPIGRGILQSNEVQGVPQVVAVPSVDAVDSVPIDDAVGKDG